MALAPRYITDKSALARLGHTAVAARLTPILVDGLNATCPIIDLELLYSARSSSDFDAILEERRASPTFPITELVTTRATDVMQRLAGRGQHRLSLPDLLIAAVAELNHLTVLHYDADFDRIATITGQPMEWVVPRGSL